MDLSAIISVLTWLIGGLIGIIIALVGILYSAVAKEVKELRDWRYNVVAPTLFTVGRLEVRVKTLEEIASDK